jgi:Holliday junction resolvase
MISESTLQKNCLKYLKERNIYALNVYGSGRTGKGTPDIIACINGRFVAFELKVGTNQMQPDQVIHKKRIERSGGQQFTPRTVTEFKKIVTDLGG